MAALAPMSIARRRRGKVTDLTGLRTVARVVEVIELVAERRPGQTVTQIAARLGLPMSSAHSVVRRLCTLGYLEPASSGRGFDPGPRMVRLGIRISGGLHVVEVARPIISELAASTGEDVYLAIPQGDSIPYADKVEGFHGVRLSIALGDPRPLHATAAGKLFLAQQPAKRVVALVSRHGLDAFTPSTVTDLSALLKDLAAIRQAGCATTVDEHIHGIIGVAAPVHDAAGKFVAAVTVALPKARYLPIREELTSDVVAAAREVSRRLGWSDPSQVEDGSASFVD